MVNEIKDEFTSIGGKRTSIISEFNHLIEMSVNCGNVAIIRILSVVISSLLTLSETDSFSFISCMNDLRESL